MVFLLNWQRHIAVNVVARFEQEFPKQIEEIYFVLFDRDTEAKI